MSPRLFLTTVISLSAGLLFSGIIGVALAETGIQLNTGTSALLINKSGISITQENSNISEQFDKYLEQRGAKEDRWLTFMWILSTFFAAFFIYSSFKIDKDLREMNSTAYALIEKLEKELERKVEQLRKESVNEIAALERKSDQEKEELRQERNFLNIRDQIFSLLFESEFENAKALLRSAEEAGFVTDDDKLNTLKYLWSKTYFAEWQNLTNNQRKERSDLLANAIIFAEQAIVDPNDPYRKSLLDAYNAMDNLNSP